MYPAAWPRILGVPFGGDGMRITARRLSLSRIADILSRSDRTSGASLSPEDALDELVRRAFRGDFQDPDGSTDLAARIGRSRSRHTQELKNKLLSTLFHKYDYV